MQLLLRKAHISPVGDGVIAYTCPFCLSLRNVSINLMVMHHTCPESGGVVYFLNGYALKNAGQYNAEVKSEVERKRNGGS